MDKKTGGNLSIVFSAETKKTPSKKQSVGPLFAQEIAPFPAKTKPLRVRKEYTFATFAVSDSNQLAYTAATTVADHPGRKYNPLFIYGSVGVGKTHLMHAIANKVLDGKESLGVLCLTTEEFTNEVVEAIRDKNTTQLRKKFRNIDLLLLDDIQFLGGKERVQEELFHTFNTLVDKEKQVVFSSDRPPSEIKKIEARLASRFEGGLTVDIEPPDFELRCAILLIKSEKYHIGLDTDDAKLIAEKVKDPRSLEGFLLKLATQTPQNGSISKTDMILQILREQKKEEGVIRPDHVVSIICSFYNIKPTQLKGIRRDAFLVLPRQVCMYVLREEVGLTNMEIGNILGGRDHTTVMHGVDKIKNMISSSSKVKQEVFFVTNKIKETTTI